MRLFNFFCLSLVILITFSSCAQNNNYGNKISYDVKFSFEKLPELFQGHYEAFAANNIENISLGKFIVNKEGQMYSFPDNKKLTGNILKSDANIKSFDYIQITIEDEKDQKKEPSPAKILEAIIEEEISQAPLEFKAIDLTQISGSFELKTPTDADLNHETSGIWFYKVTKTGKEKETLNLPPTPFGWIYEAWIFKDIEFLSIGKFGDVHEKDFDNPYSGYTQNVKFPGEDLIRFAPEGFEFPLNLADGKTKVIITLEPWNGEKKPGGDNPFRFKILEKKIPKNQKPSQEIKLEVVKDTIPKGKVEFL